MKKMLLLLILPFTLHAQKDYPKLLDDYMNAAVKFIPFSGSVLIAKGDKIIYEKTFGTSDYAGRKLLDSNSTFQLGVITEEFTAAAILLLKDKGKLKLSDPITKYFPKLPYSNVTIKHLLTHTSGLPDVYEEIMKNKWGTSKYAMLADMIMALAAAKVSLAWEPGTRYEDDHSHYYTEYPLLAAVIENVSGQTYAQFMQQHIFTPLHLQHTIVFAGNKNEKTKYPNETESIYFDEFKQQFLPADSFTYFGNEINYAIQNLIGGKGISSTAHDLFLWINALRNQKLLSASTEKEMFTPAVVKDSASKMYMGYGILIGKNQIGDYVQQREIGNAETLGYIGQLMQYAKGDVTIITLANKTKSSSNINGTLANIMFDRDVVLPYIHKQVSVDTLLLDKYVGTYQLDHTYKVYKKDRTLWLTVTNEPDLKLLPESNTKFFSSNKDYDWQIEFQTDGDGKVLKTYFIFSGLKIEAKKL